MAKLEQDVHVHLTWDAEPTEKVKNLIRSEVYWVLQETFAESSWLAELVREEVRNTLHESDKPSQEMRR